MGCCFAVLPVCLLPKKVALKLCKDSKISESNLYKERITPDLC